MECRVSDILTPTWLRNTTLLGVDLTLDDGTDYPDSHFEQAIEQAIRFVEDETGLTLDQRSIVGEMHDAYSPDHSAWWPFRLDEYPVRSVSAMRIQYGAFPAVTFPISWVRLVAPLYGQIHIIPSSEAVSSYLISGGMPFIAGTTLAHYNFVPGYFEFDYEVGFTCVQDTLTIPEGETSATYTFTNPMVDKYTVDMALSVANNAAGLRLTSRSKNGFTVSVTTAPAGGDATVSFTADSLPADIKQIISIVAAIMPLSVAGDLIAGAGVAGTVTAMDGLRQELKTTSSAMYSGYSARLFELRKQYDMLMPAVKARYRMPRVAIL